MFRLLTCLLLLVLVSTALAEDEVLVWIVRHVVDMPLDEAVAETAAHMGLKVEVDRALARKKVTVQLNDPVVGALHKLAAAAGGHLWKLDDGRYAVRTKEPPASSRPPREELEGPPESDEAPPPQPAWAKAIWKALEETPYEGKFQRTPLPDFLAALARQAGVPFHLDPAVTRGRSKRDLQIDFEDPLGDLSVEEALLLFCGTQDLWHTVRWGVLYVTTGGRWLSLPTNVFVDEAEGLPEATADVLAKHRVTCTLKRASLAKAVAKLAKGSGLEIAIDPAATKHVRRRTFTDVFEDRALGDALALLLAPAGLGLRTRDDTLEVIRR